MRYPFLPLGPPILALVLLNFSTLHAQDLPYRWTLVEELRIGSLEGPDALSSVHSIVVGGDGRTAYVGQHREGTVRAFETATGRFIRSFGRKGRGPGEFEVMGRLGLKGDTIVIADAVLQYANFFSLTGEHLRTERHAPAPIPGGGRVALFHTYLSDGTGVGSTHVSLGEPRNPNTPPMPWVKMSGDGKYLRTLGELERTNSTGVIQFPGRISVFDQPLSRWSHLRVAPNGSSIVLVHGPPSEGPSPRFTVTRMNVAGDTLYHRAYRYTPRPISPAMADSMYAGFEPSFAAFPPAAVPAEIHDKVHLPPMLPPISDVVHASDGSTWLRREESMGPTAGWLVLDADGHARATLQAPVGLKILFVEGDAVWGAIQDDLDVSYVVKYRRSSARNN